MLKIYQNHDLRLLADEMLNELQHSSGNPLTPEFFVVQNHGMARWASLYIAEREEIASNLKFKFPAELYWQLMRIMEPNIPEMLPSDRLPMTWAIFDILQNDADPALADLQRYVQQSSGQQKEVRSWNLACRIGDVFDQYVTYRPDMLMRWEKGTCKGSSRSEAWQLKLWQKLTHRWKKAGDKNLNPLFLQQELFTALDKQSLQTQKLPDRIFVFGVSEMPPAHLETFFKLSKSIDVHLFRINATENGNHPLVESMGQAGNDFNAIANRILTNDPEISYEKIETQSSPVKSKKYQLFDALKQDLLGDEIQAKVQKDDSIQVHVCHSPRREVEVLYNQLLNMLDENPSLNPADIMVLCPQMEEYAPEIDAIFRASEADVPHIPFHIAERPGSSHQVQIGFKKLLEVVQSRFKLTDVLDLLDCRPVREAFDLSISDINTLEKWIGDSNIRWGIDAEQKEEFDLPPTNSYTWQSGLHRMIAGYAMQRGEDALFDGIYPYDEIQQSDDAQRLGQFSQFIHHLFSGYQQTCNAQKVNRWRAILLEWIETFFRDDEVNTPALQQLKQVVDKLGKQASRAQFNGTVSFDVVRAYLLEVMEQTPTGGGRFGHGVAFSSIIPQRNIPAKVICMIGMDDGVFPRTKRSVEFDLIAKNPREGDRQPSKDDRLLFLETLLAARQSIYFSYVGQSNLKDVEFPPSVVLRELLDYIYDRYGIDSDKMTQYHRLHSFSPDYFKQNEDSQLFNYSTKNSEIARQLFASSEHLNPFLDVALPEPEEEFKTLSIRELVSFFQGPAKFLLQRRFGMYLREDEIPDEDREAFEMDALQKYTIRQELLDRYLNHQSFESLKSIARATDTLPEGWPGERAFAEQTIEVEAFGAQIKEAIEQSKQAPIEVDFIANDIRVMGSLDQIYEQEQLFYRFGRPRPKDLVELWIKHLLFQTAKPQNHSGRSRFYATDKYRSSAVAMIELDAITKAEEILTDLLEIYWDGLRELCCFLPETSYAYAKARLLKEKEPEKALEAAQKKWKNDHLEYDREGDYPYNKILFNNINPLNSSNLCESFKCLSISFWQPFFGSIAETWGNI